MHGAMCHHHNTKQLYRSTTNRTVSGVLGGLGEYFAIDPTALRLLFVCFLLLTGIFPGVILYAVAILIIPERPQGHHDILDETH
jgi:phage shock protein C